VRKPTRIVGKSDRVKRSSGRKHAAALLAVVAIAGCATTSPQPAVRGAPALTPAALAAADSGRPPYTPADVAFMQGMIAHHAQAVLMAGLAPTHGARGDVRVLAERIDVAQRDEIAFMQRWLRERGETVPDPDAHHAMAGHGTPPSAAHDTLGHDALMPGMLTPEQIARLRAASGAEFDRLFLTLMIQHHEGALTMVEELFATPGAGQDVNVFRFASDVTADQVTEIDRMRTMLPATSPGDRP
jgi:uncharacterized protein (DUF305 family)